jgi:hypothetical protein
LLANIYIYIFKKEKLENKRIAQILKKKIIKDFFFSFVLFFLGHFSNNRLRRRCHPRHFSPNKWEGIKVKERERKNENQIIKKGPSVGDVWSHLRHTKVLDDFVGLESSLCCFYY